jgi:membrane fusion protein, peptide pheromone/bacteriocin exporter
MKNVLPPEIIEMSVENHFSKFSKNSHIIYYSASLIIIIAFFSLFFIKIDITVLSRGIIRSASEPIPVTVSATGKIIKILLKENMYVNTGDTLVWLNTDKYHDKINHIKKLIKKNKAYLHDIKILSGSESTELRTDIYKSAQAEYRQKIAELNLNINLLQTLYNRTYTLYNKGVIPLAEKEEKEFQLQNKIEERDIYIKQSRNNWQSMAEKYETANNKFYNEISLLRKDIKNYYILSPGSGHIANYNGIRKGNFVTTGKVIAIISPKDTLIAENLVPPKDIGYLRMDMPVFHQIDSYNYNEWGLATGKIIDISKKIFTIENQPFFKVRCDINETYLSLKNGYRGEIKNGLTTTTRFKITKRTLAKLIFDKTDNWLNPKIIHEH